MKKRNIILIAIGLSLSAVASAQESAGLVRQAGIEIDAARALWMESSNAAGMSITPLNKYSIVGLGYSSSDGDFKMTQQGENEKTVGFSTNGATNIGKTYLWGGFEYGNITQKDTRFVTNIFDPFRDMPYYVADSVASKLKKQSYDLNVKVAFPQMWDFLTAGCDLRYFTNTGAKQRDPRSVTYYMTVAATPSFVFELSKNNHLGQIGRAHV